MIIAQLPAQFGVTQPVAGTALQNMLVSTYGQAQGFVGADPATPTNFALGVEASSVLNGVPFRVLWSGFYLSAGASQTVKFTVAVAPYAAAPSYTALVTPATASGALAAGLYIPFMVEAMLIGFSGSDSAGVAVGGNIGGQIRSTVGDVPTINAFAATANVTGFTFGNISLPGKASATAGFLTKQTPSGASSAYPINGLNTMTGANPALLLMPQFVQSVSSTASIVYTTAFQVSVD